MSRETVVVVCSRMPWPLDDGGRLCMWQSVWTAARDHHVVLVALVPPAQLTAPIPEALAELGVEVVRVAHRPPPAPIALLEGLAGPLPYPISRWRSRELARTLAGLVESREVRYVVLTNLPVSTVMDSLDHTPVVLREQNAEFLWMERYAGSLTSLPARLYARRQAARLRRFEADRCARAALVFGITDIETRILRALAPGAWVETMPMGIDFSRFGPRVPERPARVLLAGSLEWAPNVQGVERFLADGWPVLRERQPEVRLRIAGKGPPRTLQTAAERAGVEFAGRVESMEAEFARAAVLVVPLWVGAGARVKIIEALGAGLPVVSTPLGAEGLGLVDGEHLLIADDPPGLARAADRLLADPGFAQHLAARGRDHVRATLSLEAIAHTANAQCERAVERYRSRGVAAR